MPLTTVCDRHPCCTPGCVGRLADLVCSVCQQWWCTPCARRTDSNCPGCPQPVLRPGEALVSLLVRAYRGQVPGWLWESEEQDGAAKLLFEHHRVVRRALEVASELATHKRHPGRSGPPPDGFWLGVLHALSACLDPPALEPPLH